MSCSEISKSPDIREIVDVTLPNQDNVDRATPLLPSKDMKSATFDFIQAESKSNALKSEHFFPPEFENLPHEAKDVLKRLLEVDPKQRLRSVMSLQKIAMYKNFQIDSKHLLTLHPKDMIDPEDLLLFTEHSEESNENSTIIKEFQDF